MPPAVVGPAKVESSSLPSPSHHLGMHNSISRCTDFRRLCRSLILTCLQRMYNTVGGNAPPGAPGLVLPHVAQCPPCARASVPCGSGWVVSAPWGLRALGYVGPVLFWSATLQGPAAPIPLAYMAIRTLPQWMTFLQVTCADGDPM